MRDLPESLLAQQYGTPEVGGLTAAQPTVAEIVNLGRRAIAIQADVSKKRDTQYMVEETGRQLGDLHILVCNAGVVSHSTVEAMTEDAWDLTFAVNVKGVFLSCQAAIPVMKARGSGCIISTASVAGKNGFPGLAHYCASKFAIVGFTNSFAKELATANIRVNAICPGILRTQMWEYLDMNSPEVNLSR
jgi:meso-butanediol dehydrogenase/(S,S)-butanediol dehydrogenase/diacetyl reductase